MLVVEALDDLGRRGRVEADVDLVVLLHVAHVEGGLELHRAVVDVLGAEQRARRLRHPAQRALETARLDAVEPRGHRPHVVVHEVAHQHPGRAEDRALARDEEERDLELRADRAAVLRPRAPRNDERELARVVAAADRHRADAGRHVGVDHPRHPDGCVFGRHAERTRDARLDRRARRRHVQRDASARELRRREVAEHRVGVGAGRLVAPASVGDRTGQRAGRLRAHAEQAAGVDPADRAAARADRRDVEHRHRDPQAVDLALGDEERLAAAVERGVERRAAHVDRDPVGEVVDRAVPRAGAWASRRAREQRHDGALADDLRRHHAAVRLHDEQHAAEVDAGELRDQRVDVAPQLGSDVRVQHGRRHAVVEADRGEQGRRDRQVRVRHRLAQHALRGTLVRGVREGVEEADCDRLHAGVAERPDRRLDVRQVDPGCLGAVAVDALTDRQPQVSRHERDDVREAVVVLLLADAAAHLERVADAVGGDQPRGRAVAREHRVGRDRRPVDDHLHALREPLDVRAVGLGDLTQPAQEPERRVLGRRQGLEHPRRPVVADDEEVGERAPDVDPDTQPHRWNLSPAKSSSCRGESAARPPVAEHPSRERASRT